VLSFAEGFAIGHKTPCGLDRLPAVHSSRRIVIIINIIIIIIISIISIINIIIIIIIIIL